MGDLVYACPKCSSVVERRRAQFYWRGYSFTGLVCVACNALWDDPEDSFKKHVGMPQTSATTCPVVTPP